MTLNPTLRHLAFAVTLSLCAAAQAQTSEFNFSSSDLKSGVFDQKHVLKAFGCTGLNVSPALEWKNAPIGTKSFAIQVHDPDAPTGSGFWHWAVYNIPAQVSALAPGAGNDPAKLPSGAFGGANDFHDTGATGTNGNYGGPCPPAGDKPHRYQFTIYALSVEKIEVAAGVPKTGSPGLYGFVLNKGLGPAVLGKASFTATYGR
jgi:Raf kinase inhibitor-like YbhB/YbcL family protein